MATEIRLQKYLAQAGLASRREAERLISAGRVWVNGKPVTTLGTTVDPSRDQIKLDGKLARPPRSWTYVLLNKPVGYLVTREDTHDRKTVYDLLPPKLRHLHPVGRLDNPSCGLLLLTDDGALTQRLLHPKHKVLKRYAVKVKGAVTPSVLKRLREGIVLEEGKTQPAEVEVMEPLQEGAWLEFRLKEGKNRQIRRMAEAVGLRVTSLERTHLGGLQISGLKPGMWRLLSTSELRQLRKAAGLDGADA